MKYTLDEILETVHDLLTRQVIEHGFYPDIHRLNEVYPPNSDGTENPDYVQAYNKAWELIKEKGIIEVINPNSEYEGTEISTNQISVSFSEIEKGNWSMNQKYVYNKYTLSPEQDTNSTPIVKPTEYYQEKKVPRNPYNLTLEVRYIGAKKFNTEIMMIIHQALGQVCFLKVQHEDLDVLQELTTVEKYYPIYENGGLTLEDFKDSTERLKRYIIKDVYLSHFQVTNVKVSPIRDISTQINASR